MVRLVGRRQIVYERQQAEERGTFLAATVQRWQVTCISHVGYKRYLPGTYGPGAFVARLQEYRVDEVQAAMGCEDTYTAKLEIPHETRAWLESIFAEGGAVMLEIVDEVLGGISLHLKRLVACGREQP